MKRALKITGIATAVIILLAGIWVTDNLIYPFKAENPNFSDVEKAFNKLQFPAEWQEISSSENKGLHGRGCNPLNDAGCFHKSKTFKVPMNATEDPVKSLFTNNGCDTVSVTDISFEGQSKKTLNFRCSPGGPVYYTATLTGPDSEVYVGATTN